MLYKIVKTYCDLSIKDGFDGVYKLLPAGSRGTILLDYGSHECEVEFTLDDETVVVTIDKRELIEVDRGER